MMTRDQFLAYVEDHLEGYKSLGAAYVAVYRDMDAPEMMFVSSYNTFYDYSQNRKYWMANDYVVTKLWDLDYLDYIKEQK